MLSIVCFFVIVVESYSRTFASSFEQLYGQVHPELHDDAPRNCTTCAKREADLDETYERSFDSGLWIYVPHRWCEDAIFWTSNPTYDASCYSRQDAWHVPCDPLFLCVHAKCWMHVEAACASNDRVPSSTSEVSISYDLFSSPRQWEHFSQHLWLCPSEERQSIVENRKRDQIACFDAEAYESISPKRFGAVSVKRFQGNRQKKRMGELYRWLMNLPIWSFEIRESKLQ